MSTRNAFAQIRPHRPEHPVREVIALPVEQWKGLLTNDFEDSVFPQFPAIREIKEEMYRQGALYASMSGSGSSVYGLFTPETSIDESKFEGNVFNLLLK